MTESHPWLVRLGVHTHHFSLFLPSRTKLQCTLELRGQLHSPYFISTPICTLCLSPKTEGNSPGLPPSPFSISTNKLQTGFHFALNKAYNVHRVPECLSLCQNWVPHPLSTSECVSHLGQRVKEQHSLAGEEVGGLNSDDWKESLALCVLCELWARICNHFKLPRLHRLPESIH